MEDVLEAQCIKALRKNHQETLFFLLSTNQYQQAAYLVQHFPVFVAKKELNLPALNDVLNFESKGDTPISLASKFIYPPKAQEMAKLIWTSGGDINKLSMQTSVQRIIWKDYLEIQDYELSYTTPLGTSISKDKLRRLKLKLKKAELMARKEQIPDKMEENLESAYRSLRAFPILERQIEIFERTLHSSEETRFVFLGDPQCKTVVMNALLGFNFAEIVVPSTAVKIQKWDYPFYQCTVKERSYVLDSQEDLKRCMVKIKKDSDSTATCAIYGPFNIMPQMILCDEAELNTKNVKHYYIYVNQANQASEGMSQCAPKECCFVQLPLPTATMESMRNDVSKGFFIVQNQKQIPELKTFLEAKIPMDKKDRLISHLRQLHFLQASNPTAAGPDVLTCVNKIKENWCRLAPKCEALISQHSWDDFENDMLSFQSTVEIELTRLETNSEENLKFNENLPYIIAIRNEIACTLDELNDLLLKKKHAPQSITNYLVGRIKAPFGSHDVFTKYSIDIFPTLRQELLLEIHGAQGSFATVLKEGTEFAECDIGDLKRIHIVLHQFSDQKFERITIRNVQSGKKWYFLSSNMQSGNITALEQHSIFNHKLTDRGNEFYLIAPNVTGEKFKPFSRGTDLFHVESKGLTKTSSDKKPIIVPVSQGFYFQLIISMFVVFLVFTMWAEKPVQMDELQDTFGDPLEMGRKEHYFMGIGLDSENDVQPISSKCLSEDVMRSAFCTSQALHYCRRYSYGLIHHNPKTGWEIACIDSDSDFPASISQLQNLDPECNEMQQARNGDCVQAASKFCQQREKLVGYLTRDGSTFIVHCNGASSVHLDQIILPADCTNETSLNCSIAAARFCSEKGLFGGLVYKEDTRKEKLHIACLTAKHTQAL